MSIWHMPHNEVMKMPKLRKRIVCKEPATTVFVPQNTNSSDSLILTVDEYECIRLIDLERLRQVECANKLGVARTTAQLIYNNAREKMARALVYGIEIQIQGGNYILCDGSPNCKRCHLKNKSERRIYNGQKSDV